MAKEEGLRGQIAEYIHAPDAEDISLLRNTSEGLNIIATGIAWQAGDEVLFPANEFPSNMLPWQWLEQKGVIARPIPLCPEHPESALLEAIGPKTRLVAVSSVQFDTGLKLDLQLISSACKAHDALFSVDAIQHLGALPMDVQAIDMDFLVCGSHKWLMAPEGVGFLWTKESVRNTMDVALPGWRMYHDPFNFNRTDWTPPCSGRRFETGTVNMFGLHGLSAALDLLSELDPKRTGEELLDRTDHIVAALQDAPQINLITPTPREQRAGIVCFGTQTADAERVVEQLAAEDIYVAKRGHNIRVSPHFFTPLDQIDAFLSRVTDMRWLAEAAA